MIKKAINLALFTAGIGLTGSVNAAWLPIAENVETVTSRASMDRINRIYHSTVTLSNNSSNDLTGPFRIIITDHSIPLEAADGYTNDGTPYFDVDTDSLPAGATLSVHATFDLERKNLTFTPVLIQDGTNTDVKGNKGYLQANSLACNTAIVSNKIASSMHQNSAQRVTSTKNENTVPNEKNTLSTSVSRDEGVSQSSSMNFADNWTDSNFYDGLLTPNGDTTEHNRIKVHYS